MSKEASKDIDFVKSEIGKKWNDLITESAVRELQKYKGLSLTSFRIGGPLKQWAFYKVLKDKLREEKETK